MPTVEKFKAAPADSRISVTMTGVPSGTVKPGDALTDVEVTLCNNSPVDYPKIGVVFVLTRCSCSTSPIGLPQGTAERFDWATGTWSKLDHPVIGTGMDYIVGYTDVQDLPKGKTVTLKYRVGLDASMADGKGGVEATVVIPDALVQIGKADLPFAVSKESKTTPAPRQEVLPFTGLTNPSGVAVDPAGDVYLADSSNHRVLKLAAGSKDQTVLPFTGLQTPTGVAVDSEGNVYVTDGPNNRVVKLVAGSNDQTVLPLAGSHYPDTLAVDTAGNVYVTSYSDGESTVMKLAAGSNDQTTLPSTILNGPSDVAVDGASNVYVVDSSGFGQVVKLAAS